MFCLTVHCLGILIKDYDLSLKNLKFRRFIKEDKIIWVTSNQRLQKDTMKEWILDRIKKKKLPLLNFTWRVLIN
jgi:hypothetical protein